MLSDRPILEPGQRLVNRRNPNYREMPEPTGPFRTSRSGGHLAPVGMGALAHLIGNEDKPTWQLLGRHAAATCALGPGNAFDGHAASNLHAFWSVLGAARCDDPAVLRAYFDYMKTFLILSETHDGGLILQPWGRDRPNCNSDVAWGPRPLPTATGAILLALGQPRLQITGADAATPTSARKNVKAVKKPVRTPVRRPTAAKKGDPDAAPAEEPASEKDQAAEPDAAPAAEAPARPKPKLAPPPPRKEGEEESPLDAVLREAYERENAGGQ